MYIRKLKKKKQNKVYIKSKEHWIFLKTRSIHTTLVYLVWYKNGWNSCNKWLFVSLRPRLLNYTTSTEDWSPAKGRSPHYRYLMASTEHTEFHMVLPVSNPPSTRQEAELKQAFTRYSGSIWNSTQWENCPVNCYCTQLLITFTVNVLHLTSRVISFPRDDGLLSSLRLPSQAHFISRSVTMWMFISWINYHLTFPLS